MDLPKRVLLCSAAFYLITGCSSITEPGLDSQKADKPDQPYTEKTSSHINNSTGKWVTAYLASYKHWTPQGDNTGNLPTDEIDWDAFTHLNYFALLANSDGTVTDIRPYKNLNPAGIQAITEAGHNAGVPVLISIGGWGNYHSFSNAIKPDSRSRFVDNIIEVFSKWGFDGIDINMEPIKSSDQENYKAFVNELYNRLQNTSTPLLSRPLLTAAVHWQPELIAQVQDKFDQINIMTYNLSNAWTGWVTWHNAPVYDGGYIFPGYNHTVPSVDDDFDEFGSAGVSKQKIGIGIDFYGYVWTGVSRPKEQWEDGNAPHVEAEVPYHRIMNQYYRANYYKWDSVAEAAYLSIEDQSRKQFISYDDEHSIRSKYEFVTENNLGGVIIWDLGGGYRQHQPPGERDNLLQQVKQSFMNGNDGGQHSQDQEDSEEPPTSDSNLVYADALQESWINSSWNSNADFSNSEQFYEGTQSIKVTQNAWGALAMHNGNWGESKNLNTANYQALELAVFTGNTNMNLSISFQNDNGASFPKVNYGAPPSNTWESISIPVEQLNPNNHDVHRLVIQDASGNRSTYYIDNVMLK